ncbi:MAG: hypothetical protein P1U69_11165 [Parvibaculaceae bacterium]|nr:hypothetical protein [Parvibaculaceae bacterium]HBM87409.1 hypothetical protein [Rhodobiaceae bacterium]
MTSYSNAQTSQPWTLIGAVLALWGGFILALALAGTFNVAPTAPNLPTLLAILVPVGLGVLSYLISPAFRKWVLSLDPVLLITLHSWRMLGGVFVFFYFYNLLPGFFAFPAGFGDMAVGLAAPFVALALLHKPNFTKSRRFWSFHIFGLLDFVVAVGTGTLARVEIEGWVDGVTAVDMGLFPLVLIPALIVPMLILLHFASMIQAVKGVQPVTVHQHA